MNKAEFLKLAAAGYNKIPVYREIFADLETPLSLYLKLANQPYSYLFESVQGGEQWARYSMIGLKSNARLEVHGKRVIEIENEQVRSDEMVDDPFERIDALLQKYHVPMDLPELPPFLGGFVGYFGYDIVQLIEPRLVASAAKQIDQLNIADIVLMRSEELVVVDNVQSKAYLIVLADATEAAYDAACEKINGWLKTLATPLKETEKTVLNYRNPKTVVPDFSTVSFMTPHAQFLENVDKIKAYIVAGDAFQVVVSQRMVAPFEHEALALYRALRSLNPSPYMFFLHLDDFQIVGASPEILLRYQNGQAHVRPLAGTRKRGKTEAEDLALEASLLNDPKEIAEHVMLIDLGRNDIGRIAKAGTVSVSEQMTVERYAHVMHIVSHVQGTVDHEKYSPMTVLKAVFPAGTLSGAPKIRALEIIHELEPVKRNIYGGAIGYLSWQGEMDMAITIRSAVIKDKQISVQAGAGVVYDSDAESEWQETLNKARSVLTAAALLDEE